MNLKNNIFAILAIFCVILSACAVSAADHGNIMTDDGYLDDSEDGHNGAIIPPDANHNEAAMGNAAGGDYLDDSEDGHNGTIIPPDTNHNEAALMNATGNATAAGENVQNATGNATNATATSTMPATGNPIIALLAVGAVLGGYTVLRRKE